MSASSALISPFFGAGCGAQLSSVAARRVTVVSNPFLLCWRARRRRRALTQRGAQSDGSCTNILLRLVARGSCGTANRHHSYRVSCGSFHADQLGLVDRGLTRMAAIDRGRSALPILARLPPGRHRREATDASRGPEFCACRLNFSTAPQWSFAPLARSPPPPPLRTRPDKPCRLFACHAPVGSQ